MNEPLPDEVRYVDAGVERRVSVEEFLRVPLRKRVQMLLEGAVVFFKAGSIVERKLALVALAKHARRT
ncbi:MAG: hypothetical protein U0269_35945 [Polyangiales bacterium]